ncbi:MAG: hypothetical protein K2L46_09020 [Paramuribaculum sp.]|nr:hypothetical protein [Paramuribaculum sp.]MDE6489409.1 hypothetical protein [Paramuribaculum sp.]
MQTRPFNVNEYINRLKSGVAMNFGGIRCNGKKSDYSDDWNFTLPVNQKLNAALNTIATGNTDITIKHAGGTINIPFNNIAAKNIAKAMEWQKTPSSENTAGAYNGITPNRCHKKSVVYNTSSDIGSEKRCRHSANDRKPHTIAPPAYCSGNRGQRHFAPHASYCADAIRKTSSIPIQL